MNTWRVKLFCIDEDGSRRFMHKGVFHADTEADARECAMQAWWDPRLEVAGCSADCEVEPIEMDDDPPEDICPFCLDTRDRCECEEMGGENA